MGQTGHNKTNSDATLRTTLTLCATALFLLALAPSAFAAPNHPRLAAQDITGLNHACGTAVDSEGDLYASSAGESKIKVYGPANHTTPIAEIPDSHEPCGLAVDSKGRLYVSEKATGNVARFKPNAYPLNATPVYGSAEPFDSSGEAKGISVDPSDDRLYVTEGNRVTAYEPDGTTGQDEVQKIVIWKTVTGGTFTLKFEGQETAPISVNPSEAKPTDAEIATALEALPAIGVGNVEVEEGPSGVRSHLIVFTHALGGRDVSLLQVDSSGLSGGAVESEGMINGFPSNGHIGEGELSGASGVAAYTYSPGALSSEKRYLFVTDSNKVKVISGKAITNLHVTREIDGKAVPDSGDCPTCSEGFGPLGAGLAADWASGHFFVYDSAHAVVDEFEASGEYLDQVHSPSLSDAEPSGLAALPQHSEAQELHVSGTTTGGSFTLGFGGETSASLAFKATPAQVKQGLEALAGIGAGGVAVSGQAALGGQNGEYRILFTGPLSDRNIAKLTVNDAGLTSITGAFVNTVESGYGPGRLYASVGPSAGAKVLAFGSLAEPGRSPLAALSHVLQTAQAVATDSEGDVYAAAGAKIHVYAPNGEELLRTEGPSKVPLIEDAKEVKDVDVDSTGKVYVLDHNTQEVTYYTPSSYPPTATTTYSRHEPAVAKLENLSKGTGELEGIGLDPASDRLFVTDDGETIELGSAGEGSPILKKELGSAINERKDVAVRGPNGYLYIAAHASVYIVDPAKGVPGEVVARIDGTGSPEGRFTTINPAIAVDQANGHVVVFGNVLGAAEEFDQAGSFVARFGKFTILSRPSRLALDSSLASPNRGNLYVAYDDTAPGSTDVTAFGPLSYGEPPAAESEVASSLGGGAARLNGSVDPRGFELSACRFEYLQESLYLSNEKTFSGATQVPCAESPASIGKGTGAVPVHADLGGLDPEAGYRFRLVAENSYGAGEGSALRFGRPVLSTEAALPVLYHEATLRGTVDSFGLATKYHFDYGVDQTYGQSTAPVALPPGEAPVDVTVPVVGLEEGTVYHFRLIAENEAGMVEAPDQTLTTLARRPPESCTNAAYRRGLAAGLADCRAYELVTPGETDGAIIVVPSPGTTSFGINDWLTVSRGPGSGEALTYLATPTLPGFEGSGTRDGFRASREPGTHPAEGWKSELLGFSYVQSGDGGTEWRGGATDQHYSFWKNEPLSFFEGTLPKGVYLRTPGSISPSACDPEPQSHFELAGCGSLGPDPKAVPQFVSAGGTHVVFSSSAHLEPQAAPAETTTIYDRPAESGEAQVISLNPGGGSFGDGENATYLGATEDGEAVAFRAGGGLYLRHEGQTFKVAGSPSAFAGIAEGGKRVFYAAGEGTTPAALFACDVEAGPCVGGGEAGLTKIADSGIFVGVSPDGSHAFFSSEEDLTGFQANDLGDVAEAGKRNLYDWGDGSVRFIAVLAAKDFAEFGQDPVLNLSQWTEGATAGSQSGRSNVPTRSTPDGGVLVFQSHAQIGEYENEGHGEIYRYDPAAPSGRQLLCVSCDPSGAPASDDAMLEETHSFSSRYNPPTDAKTLIPNVTDDGGKLFFQSSDRLLPEDANATLDVYEWEADGIGTCNRADGCLALISSGQGERPSFLYSMSADGSDVFIRTLDKLVDADTVGSYSIYDAREGGGIPEASAPAPCQGDACQGKGSEPPVLPGPASTGDGGGNVVGAPPTPCAKGKRLVKGRCVSAKHRHRKHHKGRHRSNASRRAGR